MKRLMVLGLLLIAGGLELGCCRACRFRRGDQNATVQGSGNAPPITIPSAGDNVLLASATSTAPGIFAITPNNTRIEFVGSKLSRSHRGSFKQMRGTIEAPNNDLTSGRLAIEVDVNSISTDIFLLTKHLKSADFFDVQRYPTASFVTTAIGPAASKDATHVLVGQFTVHGQTRQMEVPARVALTGDSLALDCTFVIKQSEFGMTEALKKADDEVPVTVSIRAARSP